MARPTRGSHKKVATPGCIKYPRWGSAARHRGVDFRVRASSTSHPIQPPRPGQIFKFVLRRRGPAAPRRTAQRQLAGGTVRSQPDFPHRAPRPSRTFPVGELFQSPGLLRSSYPGLRTTTNTPEPCSRSFRSVTRRPHRKSPGPDLVPAVTRPVVSCGNQRSRHRIRSCARRTTSHHQRRPNRPTRWDVLRNPATPGAEERKTADGAVL